MSTSTIRQILETALLTISPPIDTVFENIEYEPVDGTPYQDVFFSFAAPSNDYVTKQYNQQGFMQINLRYPELGGPSAVNSRAELIRSKFKAGLIFSGVKITATPEISKGGNFDGRYVVPVFVRFLQHIQES